MEHEHTEPAKEEDLSAIKSQVSELHAARSDYLGERERILARKKEISSAIRERIAKLKDARAKRDELTVKVRSAKEKRTELNTVIKTKLAELKEKHPQEEQKPEPRSFDRRDRKETPRALQEQIQQLEFKIEHEGVSFEKEQKLMKLLKDTKRKLEAMQTVSKGSAQARELSTEVRKLKNDADAVHAELQTFAKSSQDYHTQLLTLSAELDELKKEEQTLQDRYQEVSKHLDQETSVLHQKMGELNDMQVESQKKRHKQKEDKQKQDAAMLKELETGVKEKIKQKKKLTTEDLLILQKSDKDE